MGTLKVKHTKKSQVEEIQRQLGEREDRLHSEHVRKWILELAAERKAKASLSVKSMKQSSK